MGDEGFHAKLAGRQGHSEPNFRGTCINRGLGRQFTDLTRGRRRCIAGRGSEGIPLGTSALGRSEALIGVDLLRLAAQAD